MTATEVAAVLRVTPRTVRRWSAEGLLEPVRLGGRLVRYAPESVEALIHPQNGETRATNAGFAKLGVAGAEDAFRE